MRLRRRLLNFVHSFSARLAKSPTGSWEETAAVAARWGLLPDRSANPLTRDSRRYWSQADEDGILEKIITRVGTDTDSRVFLEFGVGDGSENNTLALLASGWSGVWIGAETLIFNPCEGGRLVFKKDWINRTNAAQLAKDGLTQLSETSRPTVVSIDLDGNDLHIVQELHISGILPAVWIVEYNARFPPTAEWVMPYDSAHSWEGRDDYFGASLLSCAILFEGYGYFLAACSAQGANAFFVHGKYRDRFLDCPNEIEKLYQPPIYALAPLWGHKPSPRTLRSLTTPLAGKHEDSEHE